MIDLTKFKPQLVGEGDLGIFLYNTDGVFVEPKIDGVRILCLKREDSIQFFARSGAEWTRRFGDVGSEIIKGIHGNNRILDGEMAAVQDGKVLSPIASSVTFTLMSFLSTPGISTSATNSLPVS